MDKYHEFAYVYDKIMEEVDYEGWLEYCRQIWERNQITPALVADIGCGTGNMSILLAQAGYEVIGIDLSPDMLSIAKEKAVAKGADILFLNQDMTQFELYGTVDSIISLFDSINYITEPDMLFEFFKLAHNYLNQNGVLIFDMNTLFKYKMVLGERTFAQTFDAVAYIWENYFDIKSSINEYLLTLFIKNNKNGYDRVEEYHYQKGYELPYVLELLDNAGFYNIEAFDAYTFQPPQKESERIFFTARK